MLPTVAEAEAVVSRGGLVVKGTVVPKDLLRAGQKEVCSICALSVQISH